MFLFLKKETDSAVGAYIFPSAQGNYSVFANGDCIGPDGTPFNNH